MLPRAIQLCSEIISDAPLGMHILRSAGTGLDFLSQPSHMDVHGADIAGIHGLVAPDDPQKGLAAVDLVGVADQKL